MESVRQQFEANKDEIAGVILEPVVGNSGYIPPTKEFLEVICSCASLPYCSEEGISFSALNDPGDCCSIRADSPTAASRQMS